jgi:hypothetical protein
MKDRRTVKAAGASAGCLASTLPLSTTTATSPRVVTHNARRCTRTASAHIHLCGKTHTKRVPGGQRCPLNSAQQATNTKAVCTAGCVWVLVFLITLARWFNHAEPKACHQPTKKVRPQGFERPMSWEKTDPTLCPLPACTTGSTQIAPQEGKLLQLRALCRQQGGGECCTIHATAMSLSS